MAKQQLATPPKSPTSQFFKVWTVIVGFCAVIAWALVNGTVALDTSGKFWHWWTVDQAYTGLWTNDAEYSVDGADWGAPAGDRVKLAITVKGSEVVGDIHGERLCNFLPWRYVMFEGYAKWWGFGGLKARAYDFIGGKKTQLAEFNISRNSDSGTLVLEEISGSSLFPNRFVLLKSSGAEDQTVSAHNVEPFCRDFKRSVPKKRIPVADLKSSLPPFKAASSALSTLPVDSSVLPKPSVSKTR